MAKYVALNSILQKKFYYTPINNHFRLHVNYLKNAVHILPRYLYNVRMVGKYLRLTCYHNKSLWGGEGVMHPQWRNVLLPKAGTGTRNLVARGYWTTTRTKVFPPNTRAHTTSHTTTVCALCIHRCMHYTHVPTHSTWEDGRW